MASERQIRVGGVVIGGGAPVVVQSMTLTKTHDADATVAQIAALTSAGCELVRVAVPKVEDAEALPKIVYLSPVPIIADIHFNASLALKAIEAGVAAVRINPGNIGGADKTELVVRAAKKAGIPVIGLRSDIRQSGDDGGLNLMLTRSCKSIVTVPLANRTNVSIIADAIARAVVDATTGTA